MPAVAVDRGTATVEPQRRSRSHTLGTEAWSSADCPLLHAADRLPTSAPLHAADGLSTSAPLLTAADSLPISELHVVPVADNTPPATPTRTAASTRCHHAATSLLRLRQLGRPATPSAPRLRHGTSPAPGSDAGALFSQRREPGRTSQPGCGGSPRLQGPGPHCKSEDDY